MKRRKTDDKLQNGDGKRNEIPKVMFPFFVQSATNNAQSFMDASPVFK